MAVGWLGPAASITAVAVQLARPSGSDRGLFGGEASSGPGGDGQIGFWGKLGMGTGSWLDSMSSIMASMSLANSSAVEVLGGTRMEGLDCSWIELIILFKFVSL